MERGLRTLNWGDLFTRDDPAHGELYAATRLVGVARLLAPLRATLTALEESELTFQGFALVVPGTDNVYQNGLGMCLYSTREQAQTMLDEWARSAQRSGESVEAELVTARVTVKEGLELRG